MLADTNIGKLQLIFLMASVKSCGFPARNNQASGGKVTGLLPSNTEYGLLVDIKKRTM